MPRSKTHRSTLSVEGKQEALRRLPAGDGRERLPSQGREAEATRALQADAMLVRRTSASASKGARPYVACVVIVCLILYWLLRFSQRHVPCDHCSELRALVRRPVRFMHLPQSPPLLAASRFPT